MMVCATWCVHDKSPHHTSFLLPVIFKPSFLLNMHLAQTTNSIAHSRPWLKSIRRRTLSMRRKVKHQQRKQWRLMTVHGYDITEQSLSALRVFEMNKRWITLSSTCTVAVKSKKMQNAGAKKQRKNTQLVHHKPELALQNPLKTPGFQLLVAIVRNDVLQLF